MIYSSDTYDFIAGHKEEFAVAIPKEGTASYSNWFMKVRGTRHRDLSDLFLAYLLERETQQRFLNRSTDFMSRSDLWAIPLVFMLMEASLRTLDIRLFEASADLGAGPIRTFIEIGLPALSTGLLSSTLFACVISLNEFVMALFLTTRDTQTLPVLMWLSLRSASTPRLAVASMILVITVFASLIAIFLWYLRQIRRSSLHL